MRPTLHFTTNSWINDPCAPGYDPSTGVYHLFYQWNPHSCEWGNMSWGHIMSRDLLTWTNANKEPVLSPDQAYDGQGVFTGCMVPPVSLSNKHLTIFYSSVRRLPFHWSTPPYPRDAAGVAMATSIDGGKTWQKYGQNPVLQGEPPRVNVTGFRDPFISTWPQLDSLRGDKDSLYGLVSGGIEGEGPTSFIYVVKPDGLSEWRCLGRFVDIHPRFQVSPKWSGNFGLNWECVNFMTLSTESVSKNFLIIGAEGDLEREHIRNHNLPIGLPARTVRSQLWISGELLKISDDEVRFVHKFSGFLDHGSYYAASSFDDSSSDRRIVYGWIPEEDCTLEHAHHKGWNGSLAIPREVFLLSIRNVQGALYTPLEEISCIGVTKEGDGYTTLHTLGVRPISEIEQTFRNSVDIFTVENYSLPSANLSRAPCCKTKTTTWALEATISITAGCKAAGFHIRHNEDLSIVTTVSFFPESEEIVVDRSKSTPQTLINKCAEQGSFTLFETIQAVSGTRVWEKLNFLVISDGDVLEVFANGRFALATMVYSGGDGNNNGITAYATGSDNCVTFDNLRIYDGLNGMRPLFVET